MTAPATVDDDLAEYPYSVDHAVFPSADSECFETENDAIAYAIERSWDDGIYAVWRNEDGEIIALVYQQIVYTP